MLSVVVTQDALPERSSNASEFKLVSWTSSAQSRREDELARFRQDQAQP